MQLPQTKAHYLATLEEFFHSKQLLLQLFQLYKDVAKPTFDITQQLVLDLNTLTNSVSKVCTWLRSIVRSYTWASWLSPQN